MEDTPEKLAAVEGKAGAEEQTEAEQSAALSSGKPANTKPVASVAAVADAVGAAAVETAAAAVAGWRASGGSEGCEEVDRGNTKPCCGNTVYAPEPVAAASGTAPGAAPASSPSDGRPPSRLDL